VDRARQPDPKQRPAATSRRGKRAKAPARQVPNTSTERLSIDVGALDALPTEFRLFVAGVNETMKGSFLFDEAAAASVMAAYKARANDLAIDLEHQMLDDVPSPDPTSKDARGWCQLELRADGSLWATSVTWTPDGAARLTEKRQRYVSPAFAFDRETGRVTSILNIAICAIPATYGTPALVAASATAGDSAMTLEEFTKVCKALGLDMSMSLDEAMAKIKGEPAAEEAQDEPLVEAEPVIPAAADPVPPTEDKPEEVAAALSAVASLSGKSSLVASVADIRTWHASHVTLSAERESIAKREALIESAERRELCVKRVTLAGKAPSEVWASPAAGSPPKPYLLSMPIADLRAMVADEIAASGGKVKPAIKPPVAAVAGHDFATPHGVVTLRADQVAECKRLGVDPATYAANVAVMNKAKTRGSKE
jgi:phage I-like protein